MSYLTMNKKQIATEFEKHLLHTNRGYNYYVNWSNILGLDKYDVEFEALNVLIKCPDKEFYNKFKNILCKLPTVIEVFPFLFALSKKEREVYTTTNSKLVIISDEIDNEDDFDYINFNSKLLGKKIDNSNIDNYYNFFKQIGLKNLFQNHIEKSVHDYVVGVLVGLDSNGRKNRGGIAFELACEPMINSICKKYNIDVLTQTKFKTLHSKFEQIKTSREINERQADFILINKERTKAMNIEVNFYNGGGSKPDSIINDYITRQNMLKKCGIDFCLITDGDCWKGTTNQLNIGFNNINYLLNFRLAKCGMLEEIIRKVFK